MAGAHCLFAIIKPVQPVGRGAQRDAPRLYQPQRRGFRLDAVFGGRISANERGTSFYGTSLPQRLGPIVVLHDRNLVEQDVLAEQEGATIPTSGLFLGQCVGQRVRRDLACGGGVGRIGGECQRLVGDYHRIYCAVCVLEWHDWRGGLYAPHA